MEDRKWGIQQSEEWHLQDRASEQSEQQCHEKPLSPDADSGYSNAAVSSMVSTDKGDKTEYKKYIFKATRKF